MTVAHCHKNNHFDIVMPERLHSERMEVNEGSHESKCQREKKGITLC